MPDPLPRAGDRVVLRRLRRDDLRAFQAYRHDPEVGRYQGWSPQPDAEAAAFLGEMAGVAIFPAGDWAQLAIADRATGALIGDVGVCVAADGGSAEIGFTLARASQGRGLAAEAVGAAIRLVFDRTEVARVVAVTDARNGAAIRLLERLGMRRVASAPATFRGEPCVEHTYVAPRPEADEAPPSTLGRLAGGPGRS